MKILFPIHLYLPQHGAGGEAYLHNIALFLISKGHEVRVLLKQAQTYGIDSIYTYEGVEVFPQHAKDDDWHFQWADIVISHLGYATWSMHLAKVFKRPFVFVAHNDCFEEYEDIYCPYPGFSPAVIFNSEWVKKSVLDEKFAQSGGYTDFPRNKVLPPAVDYYKWNLPLEPTKRQGYITLVNCNENKGGKIFRQIVQQLPEYEFMAVVGGYDEQFIPQAPNCRVLPNTPRMQDVYADASIILMPSKYESWGMVASEAMCAGIPVICTRTPGLLENCGDAAFYIQDREDITSWVKAIDHLMKPKNYQKYSKLSRERAQARDSRKDLQELESFLYDVSQQPVHRL